MLLKNIVQTLDAATSWKVFDLDLAKHDLAVVAIPADGSEVQYVKRYSYADFLESGEELRPMHFTLPCDKIIDMVKIVYNRNCVYQTAYHMIWCPKYCKRILTGEIAETLRLAVNAICIECEWPILTLEIQPDHIHLFVTIPPSLPVADAVKILKGSTARKLFAAFPELKNQLYGGHLWSPSYYVGTAGTVSAQTIRHYIERTEHIKGRR